MRSGACVAVLLVAMWMVVTLSAEPSSSSSHHRDLTHKRRARLISHRFPKPGQHKPRFPRPIKVGNRLPSLKPRLHHKQHLDYNYTETHSGFALMGQSYYKGQIVKCLSKQTLVCETAGCKVLSCDDLLGSRNIKACEFGAETYGCTSPVICDCDNANGFVRRSATDATCVREIQCFAAGRTRTELRCPYIGCNDNATCDDAWSTKLEPCDKFHKQENCTKKEYRCPLNYYWNKDNHCMARDHCFACDGMIHEVPVCPSDRCPELTCDNVWKLRGPNVTKCQREEVYPSCSKQPVCECNPVFDYVRYNSTAADKNAKGICDLDSGCITCKANEYPYCASKDVTCKERTYEDIIEGRDTTPCDGLSNYPRCATRPQCHCIYPLIRDAKGDCVMPTKIFTQCDTDDDLTPVCHCDGCSPKTCRNPNPEIKCCGTIDALYNCTIDKLFCQCTKGDLLFNVDGEHGGSVKCVTEAECSVIYGDEDEEDYDL